MIKTTHPALFFGAILLKYVVARLAFEGGCFLEVGLLDGNYLDDIFLHQVCDVVYVSLSNYNIVERYSGVCCCD